MRSYKNSKGKVVRGVSILEQILSSTYKTMKLSQVLRAKGLMISLSARPDRKGSPWVINNV